MTTTTTARRRRQVAAPMAASALAAALVATGAASPAAANDQPEAGVSAHAQFLSGTVAGIDLDRLVTLGSASASNDGTEPESREVNPLTIGALGTTIVDLPHGVSVDIGSIISGGVVGQAAVAAPDGFAAAASGAIGSGGAVGLGPASDGVTGDLTLDLRAALGASLADAIADVDLRLRAIQASAEVTGGVTDSDYSLAGAQLRLTSPAVAHLGATVYSAVDAVTSRLQRLSGRDGLIAAEVAASLDGVLAPVGVRADVDVSIDADLRGAVAALLQSRYSAQGITVDLESGHSVLDLEALAGGTLNGLPPHTELVSAQALSPVLSGVTGSLADLADQIVAAVAAELDDARLTVSATAHLLTPQEPTSRDECRDVTSVVPRSSSTSGSSGGLVGGLLGGVLGGVGDIVDDTLETVTRTVCETIVVPRADLTTALDLLLEARLATAREGQLSVVRAELTVLGASVALPVSAIDARIGAVVGAELFGPDGAIVALERRLQSDLVDPALNALLGSTGAHALAQLLSVQVNVVDRSATGAAVTQTAVRVAVAGGSVLDLRLATASVAAAGPAGDDGDGGPGGPGGPGSGEDDAAGPGLPGSPADGATPVPVFGSSSDRLAMTGASILLALLIAAGLLLGGAALSRMRRASALALA